MDNEKVSYEEIARPHCKRTRAHAKSGVWLSIYHKAAKTVAQIDNRLYGTNKRLEKVVGMLAAIAVRILKMRTISRVDPERKVRHPKAKRRWHPRTLTIQQFMQGGRNGRRIPGSEM